MNDWQDRFYRFGYCSIPRQQIEQQEVTLGQLEAFAATHKANVVTRTVHHGSEMETALNVGIVKRSPQKEFGR